MSVIGTNIASLRATNASNSANQALQTSMERLSTGKRINSAKDDAAGLAISNSMNSQIKSLNVAMRNANDGISMAQTAEGALSEVTSMLQRMKELSTQSANGTLGSSERKALQSEVTQLTSQINDIAKTTNFNGINLLDGTVKDLKLQTGSNASDTVGVTIAGVSTDKLGLTTGAGAVVSGRVAGGVNVTTDLSINGSVAIASGSQVADAKGLADAINGVSKQSGVTATASNTVSTGVLTGSFASGTINGKAVAAATSAGDLVSKINADSDSYGVTATLNDDNSITLNNTTGSDIVTAGSAFGSATSAGFVSLSSKDGSKFTVAGGAGGNLGLNASNGVSFTGSSPTIADGAGASAGIKINGVAIDDIAATASETKAAFMAKVVTNMNAKTSETGVVATYDSTSGALTLASNNGGGVRVEGASEVGIADQGGVAGMNSGLDISSQAGASSALSKIDSALDQISSTRGDLGAVQNRLQVTVNNLTTTTTNLADAKSRIEDADFSTETTALAKAQILSQASTAMLAQANQSQQGVLKLLQ